MTNWEEYMIDLKLKTIMRLKKILENIKTKNLLSYNLKPVNITKNELKNKEKFYNDKINEILNYKNSLPKIHFEDIKEKVVLKDFEIKYSLDSLGPIIFDKDNNIYRAIYPEKLNYFKTLYESGLLQTLAHFRLIPNFEISKYSIDNYPILIKIEKITCYPTCYYSFEAKKDLALVTLLVNTIANAFGYCLIDGHQANATLYKGKPMFFDLGSFVSGTLNRGLLEFLNKNVMPLVSMQYIDNPSALNEGHYSKLSKQGELLLDNFLKFHKKSSSKTYNKILENVFVKKRIKLAYIDLLLNNVQSNTQWGNYAPNEKSIQDLRFKRIFELVNEYSSDSVSAIDIAGNSGYFLRYLENNNLGKFSKLINADYDSNAIDKCYLYQKINNSKSIIDSLLINFLREYLSCLKCDIVFALALTHHLILTQKVDIRYVFNKIKSASNKYVYVEFCPLGMYSSENSNELPPVPAWYTEEWFEKHFKMFFELLHKETIQSVTIDDKTYPHRVLFIGKIRESN